MAVAEPIARSLASGPGWIANDVVCTAGPKDRPFAEQHGSVAIALVTGGTFQYRSTLGAAVLTPGALLLGRPGTCFECGHEHGTGDRCISFHFGQGYWDAILAAVPGAKAAQFAHPQLPPLEALAPLAAEAEAARDDADAEAFEEIGLRLGGAVAALLADAPRRGRDPNSRDIRRVTASVRRIAGSPEDSHPLERLASDAAMSPYHFLRTFRQVVGMAPHQYVLRTRLHRAALRLRRSRDEIAAIAFEAGFNDLSTFNRRFKKVMGMAPGVYRAGGSRR